MRSTRDLRKSLRREPPLGDRWFWTLQMEFLGRNFAMAGALELAYRLGKSHRDFERIRPSKRRSVISG